MKSIGRRSGTASQAVLSLVPDPERLFTIVDQAVVVALRGDLTSANAPTVRAHLLTLVAEEGPQEIIVDLLDVSSIDETGARCLLEAHRIHRQRHGLLRLGAMSRPVANFLAAHPAFSGILVPYLDAGFSSTAQPFIDPGFLESARSNSDDPGA